MSIRGRKFPQAAVYGAVIGGGGSPVLTFIANANPTHSGGTTETATSMNIGTTAGFTTRRIICVLSGPQVYGVMSSATIGGISATVHAAVNVASGSPGAAIFSANVPTGTTATIIATFPNTVFADCTFATYSVDDALLSSTTPSAGSNTSSPSVNSLATSSFTQTTGGFTVAGCGIGGASGGGLAVSGYTTDALGGATDRVLSHLSSIGSTGSVTATATWTTTLSAAIAAASWR